MTLQLTIYIYVLIWSYQHDISVVLHGTVLSLLCMLAMHLSPREIAVAVVAVVMLAHATTVKVVVVVVDSVESVGVVTT